MLIDTRNNPENPEGFSPNPNNTIKYATPTTNQKIGWIIIKILCWLTIIGGIIILVIEIKWKNAFQQQQIEINTAASNIEVSLARRRDTLVKLLEQAKSYYKYEGDVQTQIAKLRSLNTSDLNGAQEIINNAQRSFDLTVENYPNLKANAIILELMSSSQYLESEISASRRLYNAKVQGFNQEIYTFPKIDVAGRMKLYNFALFAASATQKQDVDMSSLSNY